MPRVAIALRNSPLSRRQRQHRQPKTTHTPARSGIAPCIPPWTGLLCSGPTNFERLRARLPKGSERPPKNRGGPQLRGTGCAPGVPRTALARCTEAQHRLPSQSRSPPLRGGQSVGRPRHTVLLSRTHGASQSAFPTVLCQGGDHPTERLKNGCACGIVTNVTLIDFADAARR